MATKVRTDVNKPKKKGMEVEEEILIMVENRAVLMKYSLILLGFVVACVLFEIVMFLIGLIGIIVYYNKSHLLAVGLVSFLMHGCGSLTIYFAIRNRSRLLLMVFPILNAVWLGFVCVILMAYAFLGEMSNSLSLNKLNLSSLSVL